MSEIVFNVSPVDEARPETFRGGCLDGLVKTLSMGYLGIETTATVGYMDKISGKIFNCKPQDLPFQTGEVVFVPNMDKKVHNVKRRIIRSHKP